MKATLDRLKAAAKSTGTGLMTVGDRRPMAARPVVVMEAWAWDRGARPDLTGGWIKELGVRDDEVGHG